MVERTLGRRTCALVSASVILFVLFAIPAVFASQVETVTVNPGYIKSLTFNMDSEQTLSGSISVSGGSGNDVDFWITNPQGAQILNYGRVSGGTSFEFTAQSSGAYTLHFDNSFSLLSSKNVHLTYDITTPFLGGGEIGSLLTIIIVVAIIAVVVVVAVGVYLVRRNRIPSQPLFPTPPPPP